MCIGLPYCTVHSRSIARLVLKKSGTHGLGIFAAGPRSSVVFKRGEPIGQFGGELLQTAQVKRRYGDLDGPYIAELSSKRSRDGACLRYLTSMTNHARGAKANSRYKPWGRTDLMLVAKRPIKGGEEVLVDYGGSFPKGDKPPHQTTGVSVFSKPGRFRFTA